MDILSSLQTLFTKIYCLHLFLSPWIKIQTSQELHLWDHRQISCKNLINPEHELAYLYSRYILRNEWNYMIHIKKGQKMTFFSFFVLVALGIRESILRVASLCFTSKLDKITVLFRLLTNKETMEFSLLPKNLLFLFSIHTLYLC